MALARLAPSRTKADFFERLGLSAENPNHKQLYAMMKAEAAEGRRRTSQDSSNLVPQCQNDRNVHPPYSSNQITETAMHREVLNVYYSASQYTKPYYDLAHYVDGRNEDNWIIRWLLWHVFRYRDNRNRNRGARSDSDEDLCTGHSTATGQPKSGSREVKRDNANGQSVVPYDPIRDL
ncbi:hypothetical protein K490DRAFT_63465 [Saccharata proteae CBS 121410]|uniref:Uncharacterized protein n=1 Tax=Saccharata proteae CBS 121410 TaxID=1314787 RepID=A0A6A5YC94_9PEZI|nr:hypothetical protein K490DRAFT_63465 [Saccharata proteae CBS 121410]